MNPAKLQCCHSLHGVFHSNGFGHLLCINGVEGGSELAGFQIMDFWDRLCTGLRARKVSLNDASRKRGMELRLLYGLAYGEPWFGRWGYKFGHGSFGITPPMYKKAMEALQGIPLLLLTQYSTSFPSCHDIPMILSRYQSFSNRALVTLGDLFRFILQFESRMPKGNLIDVSNSGGLSDHTSCRWSSKRVEMATRVIVEALKRAQYRWISRQEVRDAARAYIGDTGLLDFVLKSLGNHIVGNFLVRRCLNPVTKVLEYSLEDISKLFPCPESNEYARSNITREQLMKDVACLYKFIFKQAESVHKQDINNTIPLITRVILDLKYFIKEYNGDLPSNKVDQVGIMGGNELKVFCTILLRDNDIKPFHRQIGNPIIPPYECFMLQEHTTIDELKLKVERTFRELYWGMRSFNAESILNLNAKGMDSVFGLVEVGGTLVVEGSIYPKMANREDINEGGMVGRRVVDCSCGAKLDDGERMVACDICEVWQHTRCVQIPNDEQVPPIFLCKSCEQEIVLSPSLP
ncbi:PHD finger protein MALE STERILITY 1 [Punica granatum]|nr:PHD finger protein MALE STERILITY 1 [Punica granatum]